MTTELFRIQIDRYPSLSQQVAKIKQELAKAQAVKHLSDVQELMIDIHLNKTAFVKATPGSRLNNVQFSNIVQILYKNQQKMSSRQAAN